MNYWLVKTEPDEYSFETLTKEGIGTWDGVRNPTARRHISQIRPGDRVLIYHTGKERAIVGLAQAISQPYTDPTDPTGKWLAFDLQALAALPEPLTLSDVKADPTLSSWELARLPRLSVMPAPVQVWERLEKTTKDPLGLSLKGLRL